MLYPLALNVCVSADAVAIIFDSLFSARVKIMR